MVCYKSHLVKLRACFLPFFLKALGNPATAVWGEQQSPAGCRHIAARSEEEEHAPSALQANLQPGHHEQLEMPPWAEISPSPISPSPWGWFGARHSALGLWLEVRVCLRQFLTRKFGQQKAEGGGVLLNGFISVETPWRTITLCKRAWAKVPRGGDKTPLSQAELFGILDAFTAYFSGDVILPGEEVREDHKKF